MRYTFPYGNKSITLDLSGFQSVDLITPRDMAAAPHPLEEIRSALINSLGSHIDSFNSTQTVAIGINDKTRPVPHEYLLPPLLSMLEENGIERKNIHLIIASGTHQPMSRAEIQRMLPSEIHENYAISCHDCDKSKMIYLGKTSYGTPAIINSAFHDANIRICVGNIETHHFMGYSGGVKTAAIGLAGKPTINHNHAMMTHPNAISGHYEDNPMRQDVEELGKMIGVHFVLNAILNTDQQIIKVLAGNPVSVMRAGIKLSRQINQIPVNGKYDLVIVSPGGYPKDINFYQSQKAMTHAGLITREGGEILLLAECRDGIGSSAYENAMQQISSHSAAMEYFNTHDFNIGSHKAYLVARDGLTKQIHLHSSLSDDKTKLILLNPLANPQDFVDHFTDIQMSNMRVAVMPNGTSTIPQILK
ncbi:MAG: nickel-dependent lactate racemase [Anaerolineaceae bacterium]|nr:nickel-dependent lactate racemase [Anaerolineaceae bacterium]